LLAKNGVGVSVVFGVRCSCLLFMAGGWVVLDLTCMERRGSGRAHCNKFLVFLFCLLPTLSTELPLNGAYNYCSFSVRAKVCEIYIYVLFYEDGRGRCIAWMEAGILWDTVDAKVGVVRLACSFV
jgi:hypothetical protein